jgi:hypothetical protein
LTWYWRVPTLPLASVCPQYPYWDVRTVRTVIPSGYVWCARPKGTPTVTINVESPEELIDKIAEAEAATP